MIYVLKGFSKNGNGRNQKWCIFDDDYKIALFFPENEEERMIKRLAEDYCTECQTKELCGNPDQSIYEILEKEYNFTSNYETLDVNRIDFLIQRAMNLIY